MTLCTRYSFCTVRRIYHTYIACCLHGDQSCSPTCRCNLRIILHSSFRCCKGLFTLNNVCIMGFSANFISQRIVLLSHAQSCQPVTVKKVLLSLKKQPYFEVKKSIFARGARITSAKFFRPGSRARLRALEAHRFWVLSGAILALFLNIIIQKLWPYFHNINNACKFQNQYKKKKN